MSYTNPVPGGRVGHTDQGVDISAPPGTPVNAIANETLVGIIPNWYQGQPFYWFKQAGSNVYNYVAEQFRSTLRIGQSVRAGQKIGTVAPSGTGLELGWATASGQTLARATTGYSEGQATAAGQSYRSQVIDRGTKTPGNNPDLAQLWIHDGGPPGVALIMAAIAMAESGGRLNAVSPKNTNGTIDYGPFQVNSSHGFDPARLTSDWDYTTRAAISVYKSQGLTAWSTYNNGAYKSFLAGAANIQGQGYGGTRPGGDTSSGSGSGPGSDTSGSNSSGDQSVVDYISLRDTPRTAPPGTRNPLQWWMASFTDGWDKLGGKV